MAKAILPAGYDDPRLDEPSEIELKEPWIAALLAWLVPGLGHLYQGRTGKGLLFFICVMGTFVFGFTVIVFPLGIWTEPLGNEVLSLCVCAVAGVMASAATARPPSAAIEYFMRDVLHRSKVVGHRADAPFRLQPECHRPGRTNYNRTTRTIERTRIRSDDW